MTKKIPFKK